MLADGEPVETADSYYRLVVASGTAIARQGLIRGGVYAVFAAQGFPLADREETVTAGPVTTRPLVSKLEPWHGHT